MIRSLRVAMTFAVVLALASVLAPAARAIGLGGFGVRVGMDLSQDQVDYVNGTQFDSARLVLGGHVDMGSVFLPKLHLVPGLDVVLQDRRKTYSINTETRYYFTHGRRVSGYAGVGLGVHLNRWDQAERDAGLRNDTKLSVNVPVGFQRGLGQGLQWFGELKMVIADDQADSSFRFSVGLLMDLGL